MLSDEWNTAVLPPQSVDEGGHHQRAEEASEREHGHREGPQQSQVVPLDRAVVTLRVGGVVKLLHELKRAGQR